MNITQDVITLKEQGVKDADLIDLLLLKGREEAEVRVHLKEFYTQRNATIVSVKKRNNNLLLGIIAFMLLIIAVILGWIIFSP